MCDIDTVTPMTADTTTVGLTGTGTAGVVLVNITQGGPGADASPIQVAYTQIAVISSIQLVAANGVADTEVPDGGGLGPVGEPAAHS